jgi:phage virion morphogenesis protein
MSGSFIKVNTEGVEEIQAALARLQQRGENLTPVFADIGEFLQIVHFERFKKQTSPEGDPWAPLSPAYLARKKRNKTRILVLNDVLSGTLHYQTTAEGLMFGTDRVYGATHQFGRPEAGIPAREFLGISDEDGQEILKITGDYLTNSSNF